MAVTARDQYRWARRFGYPRWQSALKAMRAWSLLAVFAALAGVLLFPGVAAAQADLAQGRPTTASSSYPSYPPNLAVDNNSATRWSSNFTNAQWWRVDLGSTKTIGKVELNWEAAYASQYRIQTSLTGKNNSFSDAATVNIASAGLKTTTFAPRSARYVRVLGVTRATQYGISFWDARVFAPDAPPPPPTWSDEFNGTAVDSSKWFVYGPSHPGWAGLGGVGMRDVSATSVHDGMLDLSAFMQYGQPCDGTRASDGGCLVHGGVGGFHNQIGGTYEVRVRVEHDPTATMGGVAITWPTSENWPTEGEIDYYETNAGGNPDEMHTWDHYSPTNQTYHCGFGLSATDWHVFRLEQTAMALRVYKDGVLGCTITDPAAIPSWQHKPTLQIDPRVNGILSQTQHMYVDYIRIWAP